MKDKPGMITANEYRAMVLERSPKSHVLSQCVRAFITGGIICCIGQLVSDFARLVLMVENNARTTFTSIIMVFLGACLTGIGVYDRIGTWAGAGSVVPITGFANSIVAPAMEFRREGMVMGLGSKLFTVAGPVLVYGIGTSIIAGIIYWAFGI